MFEFILQKSPFFQQYELDLREKILGDGSFSVCRRCVSRQTGQVFSILTKVINGYSQHWSIHFSIPGIRRENRFPSC